MLYVYVRSLKCPLRMLVSFKAGVVSFTNRPVGQETETDIDRVLLYICTLRRVYQGWAVSQGLSSKIGTTDLDCRV